MEITDRNIAINSWIVALFISESNICNSINAFIEIPYISVLFMLGLIAVVFVTYQGKLALYKINFYFYFFILFLLFISMVLNGYKYISEYLIYFLAFGTTSLILVSLDIRCDLVILDVLKTYLIILVIYFFRVRSRFLYSSEYWSSQMGIAYGYVIPVLFAFAYLFIIRKEDFKHKKRYNVIAVLEIVLSLFIILFDCGTRGALVSIILGCGLLIISSTKRHKTIFAIICAMIIIILVVMQMDQILSWIATTFYSSKIRALAKLSQFVREGQVDNGRNDLYSDAIKYFTISPIFGNGIGYFESRHDGGYVHEIILEIMCEYGVLGLICITVLFGKYFLQIIKTLNSKNKCFSIILLGISTILLYSSSYWLLPSFWYTFFLILTYGQRRQEKNG